MREVLLLAFLGKLPLMDLFTTLIDAEVVLVDAIFGVSDATELVLGRRAAMLRGRSPSYLNEL